MITKLWILVIFQFGFIGNPNNQTVQMNAWKAPYVLSTEDQCLNKIIEFRRLAPNENDVYDCELFETIK